MNLERISTNQFSRNMQRAIVSSCIMAYVMTLSRTSRRQGKINSLILHSFLGALQTKDLISYSNVLAVNVCYFRYHEYV